MKPLAEPTADGQTASPESSATEEMKQWGVELNTEIPDALQAQPHPVAESFAGGTGTEEDPYQIATADQLALLAELVNGDTRKEENKAAAQASYVLTADIDMNDVSNFAAWTEEAPDYLWKPIGQNYDYTAPTDDPVSATQSFSGHFDGQGHTIRGLYIISAYYSSSGTQQPYYGLFGQVNNGFRDEDPNAGVVENVTVTDSLFRLLTPAVLHGPGGIASLTNSGRIENCTSGVTILAAAAMSIGGIAGDAENAAVEKCTFNGSLQVEGKVYSLGGIVGDGYNFTINDCRAAGTIQCPQGDMAVMGGIVGQSTDPYENGEETTPDGSIIDCVNEMDGVGGGIVGTMMAFKEGVTLQDCVNRGDVLCGGLVGRLSLGANTEEISGQVLLNNCTNEGTVRQQTEADSLGGLVGVLDSQSETMEFQANGCTNRGTVEGSNSLGGLVGTLQMRVGSKITFADCTNEGQITGSENGIGGIVGMLYAQGEVSGFTVNFTNCRNSGTVTGKGYGVGGILGQQLGQMNTTPAGNSVQFAGCENGGTVTAILPLSYAGGIAGYLPFGSATNALNGCSNTGTVTLEPAEGETQEEDEYAQGAAGGLVGCTEESTALNDCAGTGKVTAPENCLTDELTGYTFGGSEPVLGAFNADTKL